MNFNKIKLFVVLLAGLLIISNAHAYSYSYTLAENEKFTGITKTTIDAGLAYVGDSLNDKITSLAIGCTQTGVWYFRFHKDTSCTGDWLTVGCNYRCDHLRDCGYANFNDLISSVCPVQYTPEQTSVQCNAFGGEWTGIYQDQSTISIMQGGPSANGPTACCNPGDTFAYDSGSPLNKLCSVGKIYTCDVANHGKIIGAYFCTPLGWKTVSADENSSVCGAITGNTLSNYYLADDNAVKKCCGNEGVINPGFEKTNLGWTAEGSSGIVHSGDKSLSLSSPSGTQTVTSNYVKLISGNQYAVNGWIYREKNGTATISVIDSASATKCSAISKAVGQWEQVSCSFTSNANQVYVKITVSGNAKPIYIDDVFLIGPGLDIGSAELSGQFVCRHDGKDWVWENARQSDTAFQIKKIDNLYDTISNGMQWYGCKPAAWAWPSTDTFEGITLPAPIRGELEIGPNEIGLSQGISGVTTGDISEEVLSQEDILRDIAAVVETNSNKFTKENNIEFSISPKKLSYVSKIKVNITNLPSGVETTINNTFNREIKVTNGNSLLSTQHQNRSSYSEGTSIGYFIPFEIILPSTLDVGLHSLNITLVQPGVQPAIKTYLLENAFEIIEPAPDQPGDIFEVNPAKFSCFEEGNKGTGTYGKILECCGPGFCLNNNPDVTRISGGQTGLLKDYYGITGKNSVVRLGFSAQSTPPSYFKYTLSDLPITNFGIYDNLEFDIIFVGQKKLNLAINDSTGKVFDDNILRYSTSGTELSKWHHIRIPIADLTRKEGIQTLRFYVRGQELAEAAQGNYIKVGGINYYMVIGLDRIVLTSGDTEYCATDKDTYNPGGFASATKIGRWINDLDKDRDACNNVASFKWTSNDARYDPLLFGTVAQTHCCGDDQNLTISESYYDAKGGCWKGAYVANNTVVPVSTILQ